MTSNKAQKKKVERPNRANVALYLNTAILFIPKHIEAISVWRHDANFHISLPITKKKSRTKEDNK